MERAKTPVVIETSSHRITGELTLPKDGYRSRLSDHLNQDGLSFVALTAVTIQDLETGVSRERDFVAVGTQHIVLAHPR